MNNKMKIISVKFVLMILIIMNLSGCIVVNLGNYDVVSAKGDSQLYEFSVGDFSGIKIEGYCEINYYAANADIRPGTVTLSVQENVREYYKVEVVNNDLVVRTTKRVSFPFNQRPALTISAPALNRIAIDGAGAFTAHDKITADSLTLALRGACSGSAELDVNHLSVDVSGAGNFKLSGRADTAGLNLSGAGDLDALALTSRNASVDLAGAGTIKINCTENLNIKANGVGTVEYRGNPGINLSRGGLVSVRQVY